MKDWVLEMLELHAKSNASMCVAEGTAQELYAGQSQWLKRYAEAYQTKRLNRNFRNIKPVAQLAQAFYEADANPKRIPTVMQRFSKPQQGDTQLVIFDRSEGQAPVIVNIDESSVNQVSHGAMFEYELVTEAMIAEYQRIIADQLDKLRHSGDEREIDLLVLVPGPNSLERDYALEALKRIGVGLIDYTPDENRRNIAYPNMVRLCTFECSRGLEGNRVVIFGIEHLREVSKHFNVELSKLGYIVLSRSRFETAIAVRRSTPSDVLPFIETALDMIKSGP